MRRSRVEQTSGRSPRGVWVLLVPVALLAASVTACGGGAQGPTADAMSETGFTFAGPDGQADPGVVFLDAAWDQAVDLGTPDGASNHDAAAETGPEVAPDVGLGGCVADAECAAYGDGVCTHGVCAPSGQCAAAPAPDGTPCAGDDPCLEGRMCLSGVCAGGLPASCDDGDPCTEDACDPAVGCTHEPALGCCAPSCAGKECGDDGCGGSCGSCAGGASCVVGACVASCTPSCAGKECGDDGCGGSCGSCAGGASCVAGACVASCAPSCAGKECGDDGCGGSCGSCAGGASCVAGACLTGGDGESCASPYVVGGVPFSVSRSTAGASNDHHFGDGACPGESFSRGGGSADHVYAFTPTASGNYRVAIDTTFDGVVYAATACGDVDGSCLGASDEHGLYAVEELVRWLPAGETVYLFVDGYSDTSDDSGSYTLTVDAYEPPQGCTPACAAKACGDDGCGGQCGQCDVAAGEACSPTGACVGGQVGTCQDPLVILSLPFSGSGTTADGAASLWVDAGACPDQPAALGGASPEVVFWVTPSQTGSYRVHVTSDFNVAVYVTTQCDAPSAGCLGASAVGGVFTDEELTLSWQAGQAYFLVIDGDSTGAPVSGGYTLSVEQVQPCSPACDGKVCGEDGCGGSCGSCGAGELCVAGACATQGQGESCASPFVLSGVPATVTGDTTGASKDFGVAGGSCPGLAYDRGTGSADHVYAFTPPADGDYALTLDASFDTALYVLADCADADGSCVGGVDLLGTETLTVYLLAAHTYYVIVDGYSAYDDLSGTYTLTVAAHDPGSCTPACAGKECGDDGCGGHCGSCLASGGVCTPAGLCQAPGAGETCAAPFALTGDPASASGDTTGASKDFAVLAGQCPGLDYDRGAGSSDHVYAYTPAVDGTYEVSVDPSFDAALYVVTDCGAPGGTCLGGSDNIGAEHVTVSMAAGTTYYVIVDGYSAYSDLSGTYTLTVQGTDTGSCTPACDGKECGDDGCGGTCGACGGSDTCMGGTCAAPGTGDTCTSPFPVGALPYTAQTTTALGYDDVYGDCSPAFTTGGDGSTDHIYRLVAPGAGTYTVTVDPDGWDALVYALSACDAVAPPCLAGVDGDGYGGVETLTLELSVGQEVWIVVDGYTISGDEYGPYTISISGP